MRLTEVRLDNFRNLASGTLEVPFGGAVLVGDNGQGKTNLLEAIQYLAAFRSFRGVGHGDAIAFGSEHFRVQGHVEYADGRSRTVAVAADRQRRKIVVDGREADRPGEARGALLTVLLRPSDLALVDGEPAVRRRWLDALLARAAAGYARALREYDRVLRQRNELLRGPERAAAPVIESWDEALVAAGGPLVEARSTLVRRLGGRFDEVASAVAGDGAVRGYGLEYRPRPGPADDLAGLAAAWRAALVERYRRDRARGWTSVGPHRDDLALSLGGRALGRFGSQGERRTAAIALRLLEAEVLEADTGHRPVLLLDDVFTELDAERAARLLEWLGDRHQRFITSPRALPGVDGSLAR
ncbi:MAG TPA: DNA replication and repair protein RecF, partial [Gemmatimonadota bacterium]|nr:DNA replication and repair protein RecF [Gemmatimonadota bacterium]